MDESKLTGWFSADVKPARPGVYQVRTPDGIGLPWLSAYRAGKWYATVSRDQGATFAASFGRENGPTDARITEWRGLAHPPKGA